MIHFYKADDYSEANILRDKVRILCMVMTIHDGHYWKSKYLKDTWGKRCNKLLFMSDINDPRISAVKVDVEPGRDHLTAKTMKSFEMAYRKFSNAYNWFLKADDDTYIIVENLRYLLSTHSADEPVYFGHHFQFEVDQGSYCNKGYHPKSILNSIIEKTCSSITSILFAKPFSNFAQRTVLWVNFQNDWATKKHDFVRWGVSAGCPI